MGLPSDQTLDHELSGDVLTSYVEIDMIGSVLMEEFHPLCVCISRLAFESIHMFQVL